jgi:beta-glucosidase
VPFPDDFWWGTAASSTQTEGAAPRADWYRWERDGHAPLSGDGNGFATNYRDDFALLAEYGLTHHRLSIEWARIEPAEGKRDGDAIDRYTDLLRTARDAGLAVWVCLHHFTLPGWFSEDMKGFLDDRGRSYYWARHVDFMGETFGDLVFGWKPINEPVAFAGGGWLLGATPPGKTDLGAFFEALEATHLANHEAWRLLRSGGKPVATIHNLSPLFPADERPETRSMLDAVDDVYWRTWIRAMREGILHLPGRAPIEDETFVDAFDLVGFSYYAARRVHADGRQDHYPGDAGRLNPLGDAAFAEGLRLCLDRLADELPRRDLLIAECGWGTDATRPDDDEWRVEYLGECLRLTEQALDDGLPVRGFFHWTAVDNYEWTHGYAAQFGLFDRDRRPKPSAELARRWATPERSPNDLPPDT